MSPDEVRTGVWWDERFTAYNFGSTHPMNPLRLDLTARLCRAFGLFDAPGVRVHAAALPDGCDDFLSAVHTAEYIDAVRRASGSPESAQAEFGLGTEDDPAFAGMHEVSALIAAGTRAACESVASGELLHAVNFSGGLHHAMPGNASGFCVYNDAAIGIRRLLELGVRKVAYVDVDVHHGDGVEKIFWDDPRVLTISIHESGQLLFPGTGFPGDIGGPHAKGSVVNVALPAGVGDAPWLRAVDAVVTPLLHEFAPQVLVTQHGCDSHYTDPLAHMALTVDAQRAAAVLLHDLAHRVCGGRWVALGGGGYEPVEVVPRTWTHLTGIAAHRPIDPTAPVPQPWLTHVHDTLGVDAPATMGDGATHEGRVWWRSWSSGCDPSDRVDRCVLATREAIFPLHGLDVWFD